MLCWFALMVADISGAVAGLDSRICLHRSEQKGRYLLASVHSTFLPQVGQSTIVAMMRV
jgi:hypothetical protein